MHVSVVVAVPFATDVCRCTRCATNSVVDRATYCARESTNESARVEEMLNGRAANVPRLPTLRLTSSSPASASASTSPLLRLWAQQQQVSVTLSEDG